MDGLEHRLFGHRDGAAAMQRRRLGRGRESGDRRSRTGAASCRSWSAAPAFTFAPCSTASPRCLRSIPPSAQRFAQLPWPTITAPAELDPEAAARLHANDTTRIARALEVVLSTGAPLESWQQAHAGGIRDEVDLFGAVLLPTRDCSTPASTAASPR